MLSSRFLFSGSGEEGTLAACWGTLRGLKSRKIVK